ncbi:MAG: hypothetical protein ACTSRU_11680 [Candidatus Hodarchaeales archaeon]
MKFDKPVKRVFKDISHEDFFDGKCPFCGSTDLVTRTSRVRELADLGSTVEKVIVRLVVTTFRCKECSKTFTPEHPLYPPKFEYSHAIIEYSLTRYHYHNVSGNIIARDLALLHNISVSEATVYSWLKQHSPEFLKSKLDRDQTDIPGTIKAITVDGTFVATGKDIIGKKKHVDSLSVTKLASGEYLLMWWE